MFQRRLVGQEEDELEGILVLQLLKHIWRGQSTVNSLTISGLVVQYVIESLGVATMPVMNLHRIISSALSANVGCCETRDALATERACR